MLNPIKAIERKIAMNIIASLVERVCKNWIPTVLGFLLGLAGVIASIYKLIPSTAMWHGYNIVNSLLTVGGVAVALAGAIAKNENIGINPPTLPTKVGLFLLLGLALSFPPAVKAQATATNVAQPASISDGFSASGGPVAIHYNGTWSAASFTRESYDVADFGAAKSSHLYIQGVEVVMPTPGVNLYLGGLAYRPDISKLFQKTNLPAGSFGVFFDGNVGNGVPSTGPSHISWVAGGGVLYKLTDALSWTPLTAQYGRFGGTGFSAISTQLQFIFGGQK